MNVDSKESRRGSIISTNLCTLFWVFFFRFRPMTAARGSHTLPGLVQDILANIIGNFKVVLTLLVAALEKLVVE